MISSEAGPGPQAANVTLTLAMPPKPHMEQLQALMVVGDRWFKEENGGFTMSGAMAVHGQLMVRVRDGGWGRLYVVVEQSWSCLGEVKQLRSSLHGWCVMTACMGDIWSAVGAG